MQAELGWGVAEVQSLVRELRSHMSHGMAKKFKASKKEKCSLK